MIRVRALFAAVAVPLLLQGCAVWHLTGYAIRPDYPRVEPGDIPVDGLSAPVAVTLLPDGRPRIEAANEMDLARITGYMQARDRLFQMDLLRHLADGRLAELVGDVPFGSGTALDSDRFFRFAGLRRDAQFMYASATTEDQALARAFAEGVNAWVNTGHISLEHRLLGVPVVRQWTAVDTFSVFRFIMFGMTHNWSREIRRLVMACDAGIDGAERIWPSVMEFGPTFLPPESLDPATYPVAPAIVPEMRAALADLCPKAPAVQTAYVPDSISLPLLQLRNGISASNNWAVAGSRSASGKPILENDPHLPHMNPPFVWGVHQKLPGREIVGFTLPGVPLVTFGQNLKVAWAATINSVDLQDLYVYKPGTLADGSEGYVYEDDVRPFEYRVEEFRVKGGDPVTSTARFTHHGLILNDVDPFLRDRIPLTALRGVQLQPFRDAGAMLAASQTATGEDFARAMQPMDTACISWLYADVAGNIGFTSPCRVPVRPHHFGTFAVPGWLAKYEWDGFVPKERLPRAHNPERGWLATANNQAVPFDRFYTAYNNDANPPNRYMRLSAELDARADWTPADMAKLALDVRLAWWSPLRASLDGACARGTAEGDPAARRLATEICGWDGDMSADATAATLFVHWTHAVLDLALADELREGPDGAVWRYVQEIPHFEANVDWMWQRPVSDAVWDDARTEAKESRDDILVRAFALAATEVAKRYGPEAADLRWGSVRPFYLKHPFGGLNAILAGLLNGKSYRGVGAPETVFKNQFSRSDRESMHPGAGPAMRTVVDLANPGAAEYAIAGGASGWARSPSYDEGTEAWLNGAMRPMVPEVDGPAQLRFIPPPPSASEGVAVKN